MTNHIPNDLSYLSDAEFNSLSPQGEHAPGPEPLSPAAHAIHDAYWNEPDDGYENTALAACLRAVSEQLVPKVYLPERFYAGEDFEEYARQMTRQHLLAIADELDGYPDDKLTYEELEEMEQGISAYYDSLALQHPGKCVFHTDEPPL